MKKISVIIPNWNGKELLKDCLESLRRLQVTGYKQSLRSKDLRLQVIVVDNGSIDGSIEYVEKNFPEVKIITLKNNYGFARAINEGVRVSTAEYVVFLNNDTETDKNFLKELVQCAESHPEVISINPKLLNFYNRKIIDGVGILINEAGQAKSIGWQEKDTGQFNEQYIFGATGGASLFRREDFIKAGMFDEKYFMYSEEVDFAFRAQFLGYKSFFCPKAVVYHKHKATSKKMPAYLEYWQFRNMTQTIIKDFPTGVLLKNWRWLKIILVHFNTYFYQIKNGFLWAPFMADLWILFHLPHLLSERRKIQKSRKVNDSYIENFFVEKKVTFWGLWK